MLPISFHKMSFDLTIIFIFLEIRKSHPKFKTVFTKSSNILDSFGFEFAKVSYLIVSNYSSNYLL